MTAEIIKKQIEIITRYNKYIDEWLNDPTSTAISIENLKRLKASNTIQLIFLREALKNKQK